MCLLLIYFFLRRVFTSFYEIPFDLQYSCVRRSYQLSFPLMSAWGQIDYICIPPALPDTAN